MRRILLAGAFLLGMFGLAGGAHAACPSPNPNLLGPPNLVDGCPMPASVLNGMLTNSTAGFFQQLGSPPTTLVSWLNTNNVGGVNPYGYLGRFGMMVVPTTFGEPAVVGASQSSQVPIGNSCCSQGVSAVEINNNTSNPQGAWVYYGTGTRVAGAGSLVNEFDIFNQGTLIHLNPYAPGAAGETTLLALQCGGEPVTLGLTGTHCSVGLKLGTNGDNFDTGILFPSTLGTIHAIEMATSQQLEWHHDSSGTPGAWVSSNVSSNTDANSLMFTNSGAFFSQGTTQYSSGNPTVNAAVSNNPGVTVVNHLVLQGAATGNPAKLFAQGDDTNNGIAIVPNNAAPTTAGGSINLGGPMIFQGLVVGSLPACSSAIKGQIYEVTDASSPVYNNTLSGTGSSTVLALCDGSTWKAH